MVRRAWPAFLFLGILLASFVWPRIAGVDSSSLPPSVQWGELLVLFVAGILAVSRLSRWTRLHNAANDLMLSGNLEAAARGFEDAIGVAIATWQASTSRFGLALVRLQLGDPRRARDSLVAVRTRWLPQSIQVATPFQLAYCQALLGELGEARRWLDAGAKRYGAGLNPIATLSEAIVLVREGRFEQSNELLTREWRLVESGEVRTMKHARAVKAFALHKIGGEGSASAIDDLIAGMKPLSPGDLEALAAAWPEMGAFLAERRLLAASAA